MTTQTPEALRLAEILEGDYCPDWLYERGVDEVAAELRRLHAYCQELEAHVIRDCMSTQQPAPATQQAGDALSDAMRVPLDSLHADAAYLIGRLREGSMPYARVIEIIRERIDAASPTAQAAATQQAEVRPVTPYTCPKCHALWLHWPAEQTGFGRDTLNCRSADHCHYCEKAGVEQLQRLERIPAALHAPQPSPTAQAAESVPAPPPPPECETEAEKRAFAFGWFKAQEADCAARAPADSVLEDAACWHWIAEYLVGTRTDLDDGIVASETVNDLRKLVDAARKQGGAA